MAFKFKDGKFRITKQPLVSYEILNESSDIFKINNRNTIGHIRSFDIFDTIIARKLQYPSLIFDIIEKEFPYHNFKYHRTEADRLCNGTIHEIYDVFKQLANCDDDTISKLLQFEIETEIRYSYLILPNYNEISDGDILVSDMYFTEDILQHILKQLGFQKQVKIYVSRHGKRTGVIWKHITERITLHMGDNLHSDVHMPLYSNISTLQTNIHELNKTERFFIEHRYSDFAFALRYFRHQNPYRKYTHEYMLYNDQVIVNIPFLILISNKLNSIMQSKELTTILLTARDGCLLEHIFPILYPNYITIRFETSRHMYLNPSVLFINYVKSIYHEKCLIFDLDGSFNSGRKLFMEVFGCLPYVYILNFYTRAAEYYDKIISSMIDGYPNLNTFNVDTVGKLINYPNRETPNYDINHAQIYKDTVIQFMKMIDINSVPRTPDLIYAFYQLYWFTHSNFKKSQED